MHLSIKIVSSTTHSSAIYHILLSGSATRAGWTVSTNLQRDEDCHFAQRWSSLLLMLNQLYTSDDWEELSHALRLQYLSTDIANCHMVAGSALYFATDSKL